MAKRSKKKNPNALNEKQRADIRHNQTLDLKKDKLDKNLNITVSIVIVVAMISFLLLPSINMNFSGSLSEFLGDWVTEEQDSTIEVVVDMSNLDFLFAMTKGYGNSIEYIVNSNSSGISAKIIYNAFMTKVTQQDIDLLDTAYIFAFILSILLFISIVALIVVTSIQRRKKVDGKAFMTTVIIFSALAIVQWIFYIIVGIISAGRAQIQPHVASYLLFAGAIALCSVYGCFRAKIKNLNSQRKPVEEIQQSKDVR